MARRKDGGVESILCIISTGRTVGLRQAKNGLGSKEQADVHSVKVAFPEGVLPVVVLLGALYQVSLFAIWSSGKT